MKHMRAHTLAWSLIAALAVSTGAKSDDVPLSSISTSPGTTVQDLHDFYAAAAMRDRLRRDRDTITPALLQYAELRSRTGLSANTISYEITQLRKQLKDHQRLTTTGDYDLEISAQKYIWAISRLNKTILSASIAIDLTTDIAEYLSKSSVFDKQISDQTKSYQNYYVEMGEVILNSQNSYRSNPVFREIYDQQFLPTREGSGFGFKPIDHPAFINDAHREFAESEYVKQIYLTLNNPDGFTAQINKDQVTAIHQAIMAGLHENTQRLISEISAASDNTLTENAPLHTKLDFLITEHQQQAARAVEAREERRIVAEWQAGATMATQLIGLVDPKLGKDLGTVSNAAFAVADTISKLNVGELGTLAATGNFVSLGLSLISAFGSSGPSVDQLIMEQLAAIREDIAELREEMHQRFDLIDERLDAIYGRLDAGFVELERQLVQDVGRDLDAIRRSLESAAEDHRDLAILIIGRTYEAERRIRETILGECLAAPALTNPIDAHLYQRCVGNISQVLSAQSLRGESLPVVDNPQIAEALSRSSPDMALRLAFSQYQSTSTNQLPFQTIAPLGYLIGVTDTLTGFLRYWPQHHELFDYSRLAAVQEGRIEAQRLARFREQLAQDFATLSEQGLEAQVPPAILLRELKTLPAELDRLIRSFAAEHARNQGWENAEIYMRDYPVDGSAAMPTPDYWEGGRAPTGYQTLIPSELTRATIAGMGEFRRGLKSNYKELSYKIFPIEKLNAITDPGQNFGRMISLIDESAVEINIELYKWTPIKSILDYISSNCGATEIYANLSYNNYHIHKVDRSEVLKFEGNIPDKYLEIIIYKGENSVNTNELCFSPRISEIFLKNQKLIINHIADQSQVSPIIEQIDQIIDKSNFLMLIWMRFGLHDTRFNNDTIAVLTSGQISIPTIGTFLQRAQESGYVWDAHKLLEQEIDAYISFFQSDVFKSSLNDTGYADLEEALSNLSTLSRNEVP